MPIYLLKRSDECIWALMTTVTSLHKLPSRSWDRIRRRSRREQGHACAISGARPVFEAPVPPLTTFEIGARRRLTPKIRHFRGYNRLHQPGARSRSTTPDWLFDTKYDGFRAVCYVENRRCSFVSRRGNAFTRFDALCEQVASALCHDVVSELGVDEAILDGEVIVADETGRPQFYDLLRRTRSPIYVAFDLLWFNGADLRSLPLCERRRRLQGILPPGSPSILEAVSVERRGRELFHLMCVHDCVFRSNVITDSGRR